MAANGIFYNGVWSCGFDFFTSPLDVWDTALNVGSQSISSTFARFTGQGIQQAGSWLGKNLQTNQQSCIFGFAFKTNQLPVSAQPIFTFYDTTANAAQFSLCYDAQGKLQFYYGGMGAFTLGAAFGSLSSTSQISINSYVYIEIKCTISNSVGVAECRVNGSSSPVISFSGDTQTTANAYTNRIYIGERIGSGGAANEYDDIYGLDLTGSAPYNDYLGNGRCVTDVPSGNSSTGGLNQWTPTNPTNVNYTNVGNIPANSAEYNADGTVGHRESYQFPSLSTSKVFFLNEWFKVEEDSAGSKTVIPTVRSNSVDGSGATVSLPGSFTYFSQPFTIDPNTGASFAAGTVAAAQACELGLEVNT